MNDILYSSQSEEWSTPQDLFDKLNEEFHFAIDAAATPENAKCKKYYTKHQNSLIQKWSGYGAVWCNPPYGRGVKHWVHKAYAVSSTGTTVVMLLPARTDTEWFHEYVLDKAEIRFIRGRLKFGGAKNSAPFPSMIVVFRGGKHED